MQKKYFGTDGIRAASNSYKLNGLTMMRLGMSLGKLFTKGEHKHRVVKVKIRDYQVTLLNNH